MSIRPGEAQGIKVDQVDDKPQKNKILIISSNKSLVVDHEAFLTKQGYSVHISTVLDEALVEVNKNKPDAVLISWNMQGADVKKTFYFISEKLKIPCFVFSENTSAMSAAALQQSNIPNILLPPVTGATIHRRIQQLFAPKETAGEGDKKTVYRALSSVKYGGVHVVQARDVLEEVKSNSETPKKDPQEPQQELWLIQGSKFKTSTHFFKGPLKPEHDGKLQIFKGMRSANNIMMMSGGIVGKDYKALQNASSSTSESQGENLMMFSGGKNEKGGLQIFDRAKDGAMMQATAGHQESKEYNYKYSDKMDSKEYNAKQSGANSKGFKVMSGGGAQGAQEKADKFTQKKSMDTILLAALREALQECRDQKSQKPTNFGMISKFIAVPLPQDRVRGYLFLAIGDNEIDKEIVTNLLKRFEEKFKGFGYNVDAVKNMVIVEINPFAFSEWCKENGQFLVSDSISGKKIAVSHITCKLVPVPEEIDNGAYFSVDFEDWILRGSKLLFDLYINLPKNKKYLCYLRKGITVTPEAMFKFQRMTIRSVFYKPEERDLFYSYCIQNRIESVKKKKAS